MIQGVLNRILHQDKQTLGWFTLYDGIDKLLDCAVLELPFLNNQQNISSVCAGVYEVKKRKSESFGWHFHLQDVEDRSLILIHKGNYYTDIRGCLLFGNNFKDINKDGYKDVTISKRTMQKLLNLAPSEWQLTINEI